jgi:hypothetical protein
MAERRPWKKLYTSTTLSMTTHRFCGHFIDESEILQTDVPAHWASVNLPTSSNTFGNPSYQAVVHLANTIRRNLPNEIVFPPSMIGIDGDLPSRNFNEAGFRGRRWSRARIWR